MGRRSASSSRAPDVSSGRARRAQGALERAALPLVALALWTAALVLVASWPAGPSVTSRLSAWDGAYYLRIAEHGYPRELPAPRECSPLAFFPLYPLVLRGVHEATGLGLPYAAVAVSVVAATFAVAMVAAVASALDGDAKAGRTTGLLWATFPVSFVVVLNYSDALFVMLCSSALWLMTRHRWLSAGALAGAAGVTRPTGAALVVAYAAAVLVSRRGGSWLRASGALLAVAPLATWWVGLRALTGSWSAWLTVQREGCWGGRPLGVVKLLSEVARDPTARAWYAFVALTVVLACVSLGVLVRDARARPRSPLHVACVAFCAVVLLMTLVGTRSVYTSAPRQLWAAFPLFVPLARQLGRHPWLAGGAAAAGAVALLVLSVGVALGRWQLVP